MATVTLGNIKFNWKGPWNSATAYVVDDVVSLSGSSYVCIQAGTNQNPSTATAYWEQMSSAGTNGTDLTTTLTTQGDILYRDGSGLQRLAKGTAGQVLKMNSSANAPEWGTDQGGKIGQVICVQKTDTTSYSGQSWADISGMTATITPSATSSKILWAFHGSGNSHNNYAHIKIVYGDGSNLTTQAIGDARGSRTRSTIVGIYDGGNDVGDHWSAQGLDSPNTTSATTYKLQWYVRSGNVQLNYRNYDVDNIGQETAMSSITLMEIL